MWLRAKKYFVRVERRALLSKKFLSGIDLKRGFLSQRNVDRVDQYIIMSHVWIIKTPFCVASNI